MSIRKCIVSVAVLFALLPALCPAQGTTKGASESKECPKCHGTTPKQGKYCMHCGRKLPESGGSTLFPTKTFCLACGAFAFGAKGACDQCSSTNVRVVNYVLVDPKAAAQVIKCRECGASMRRGAKYCPDCGAAAKQVRSNTQASSAKCAKCGAARRSTSVFCPNCGVRYKK